jgi:hypothetical protein
VSGIRKLRRSLVREEARQALLALEGKTDGKKRSKRNALGLLWGYKRAKGLLP